MAQINSLKDIKIIKGKSESASKKNGLRKNSIKRKCTLSLDIGLHQQLKKEQMTRELNDPNFKKPSLEDIILECVIKHLGFKNEL